MKASEVYATWLRNGATPESLKYDYLVVQLFGAKGDYETNSTPELMAISEAVERRGQWYSGLNATCPNCDLDNKNRGGWEYGHRPNWWVCPECKSAIPCPCRFPDEEGHCTNCGRKMTPDAIADYERKEAEELAHRKSLERPYADTYEPCQSIGPDHPLWNFLQWELND